MRVVSVFWGYLVVIFGIITICPLYYYEKSSEFLPLGTVYANYPLLDGGTTLLVLLFHTLSSIVLASIATLLHQKTISNSGLEKHNRSTAEPPQAG